MTDHVELTEGDRVVFTGYAPSKPEISGVITQVLRRPAGHPEAGQVTGIVIEVTDGHGATLCAEPHQLRAATAAPPASATGTTATDSTADLATAALTTAPPRTTAHTFRADGLGNLSRVPGTETCAICGRRRDDPRHALTTVRFEGGPWHGKTYAAATVTAPVFAAGSATGRDYWLDQNSDPPTYRWNPEPRAGNPKP